MSLLIGEIGSVDPTHLRWPTESTDGSNERLTAAVQAGLPSPCERMFECGDSGVIWEG